MRKTNPRNAKAGRWIAGILACLMVLAVLGLSAGISFAEKGKIAGELSSRSDRLTEKELSAFRNLDADCIMVLGAAVKSDGTPTPMLQDRLDTGIALYKGNAAPKLLLTGDNGQEEYNEVGAMLRYALDAGVPEEDIFLDHAGFSTYDSIYRAGYIFEVKRVIVVTQTYHLFRALYGCGRMGLDALGAGADQDTYRGRQLRELREVLARDKDWVKWAVRPEPAVLGEKIPISGDGRQTQ
ncbi:MAG: YdcF family protein [Firmicutes bacterium]|nr:YdcF family protein [Bacillota bacterium]